MRAIPSTPEINTGRYEYSAGPKCRAHLKGAVSVITAVKFMASGPDHRDAGRIEMGKMQDYVLFLPKWHDENGGNGLLGPAKGKSVQWFPENMLFV